MNSGVGGTTGRALTIDQIRAVQLTVLDKFTRFCDQENLRYMAAYGTLLGAVRHHGYIPWDDDIDLMMPRADYERLRATTSFDDLVVGGHRNDPTWPYANVKVCDTHTVVDRDGPFGSMQGVNIDVFPVDRVPEGIGRLLQYPLIRLLSLFLAIQAVAPREGRGSGKSMLLRLVSPVLSRVPRWTLLQALDRLARIPHRAHIRSGVLVGSYQWAVPTEAFDLGDNLSFEGRQVPAPADVDAVLVSKYGRNYMSPPPAAERHSHHTFTASWK